MSYYYPFLGKRYFPGDKTGISEKKSENDYKTASQVIEGQMLGEELGPLHPPGPRPQRLVYGPWKEVPSFSCVHDPVGRLSIIQSHSSSGQGVSPKQPSEYLPGSGYLEVRVLKRNLYKPEA